MEKVTRHPLQDYIVTKDMSIVEAMQRIDKNTGTTIYVVDDDQRLCGSVTDGDIRRGIIRSGRLKDTLETCMFRNVKYLFTGDSDRASDLMAGKSISSVPIVDADMHIVDIIFSDEDDKKYHDRDALKDTPVIIMAGGKGTRLYPYTKILPKPLIPIGDIPILERILNRFYDYGVDEFYLTVNYRKEMIKSYFKEARPPYTLHYVEEEKPLGTAGSITLIDEQFHSPVFITNCDILIEAEYDKLLDFHKKNGNDMTIVSSLRNQTIPYGVLHSTTDGMVTSLDEKPQLSYLINTGMYVVNPEYLKEIPKNTFYHMPQLVNKLMDEGHKVGVYPISENSYLDMGQFEEMKKMEERVKS